jgi:hypothetical protein
VAERRNMKEATKQARRRKWSEVLEAKVEAKVEKQTSNQS